MTIEASRVAGLRSRARNANDAARAGRDSGPARKQAGALRAPLGVLAPQQAGNGKLGWALRSCTGLKCLSRSWRRRRYHCAASGSAPRSKRTQARCPTLCRTSPSRTTSKRNTGSSVRLPSLSAGSVTWRPPPRSPSAALGSSCAAPGASRPRCASVGEPHPRRNTSTPRLLARTSGAVSLGTTARTAVGAEVRT